MSDLVELYQELVLDHNNRPRNKRVMEDASNTADGYNPLCGDQVSVFLKVEEGVIADVSFQGVGCGHFPVVGVDDDAEREGQACRGGGGAV